MAVQDKTTLKSYFVTGATPTQVQFEDLIDSLAHINDSVAWLDVFVSPSGDDADDGSEANPVLTFGAAVLIAEAAPAENIRLNIAAGTYREHLDTTVLADKVNVHVIGEDGQTVRIMNSTNLTGFSKTAGYSNVYECAYGGTMASYLLGPSYKIFEVGAPSGDTSLNYPQVRHLEEAVPFSVLGAETFDTDLATTLTNLDAQPEGGCYLDAGTLYFVCSDLSNPTSNGYTYEVAEAAKFNATLLAKNLFVDNLDFWFSYGDGCKATAYESIVRRRCVAAGNSAAGFLDSAPYMYSQQDVAFHNAYGGIAAGYQTPAGPPTPNDYKGNGFALRESCWAHNNYRSGFIDSSIGLAKYQNCLSSANEGEGYLLFVAGYSAFENCIADGNSAAGFVVRQVVFGHHASMRCTSCLAEANESGFFAYGYAGNSNNSLELMNCAAYENTVAEVRAEYGTLISRNTKAENADPLKLKVIGTGGTVTVKNGDLVT